MHGWLPTYQRRQQERRNFARFRSLIAVPVSLGDIASGESSDALVLPGAGVLSLSTVDAVPAGKLSLTAGSHSGARSISANSGVPVRVVRAADATATDFSLYVLDPWRRPHLIASGSLT